MPLWYDAAVPLQNFDLFDAIIVFHPQDRLLNEGLKQGHLPAWNPYGLGGHPLVSDGQSGLLYPLRLLLHLLLPADVAHDAMLFLHTLAAGLLMFAWARRVGMSAQGALLCGTAWMLNGFVSTWLELEHALLCAALIPLLLLLLDAARSQRRSLPWAVLAIASLITSGHTQMVLYALFIVAAVLAWRVWEGGNRPAQAARVALALGLGIAAAAPMLLPTLAMLGESQRPTLGFDFLVTTYREFLAGWLPTLLVPDAWGSPIGNFAWIRVPSGGNFTYQELCCYGGVVPLALACWGAAAKGMPRFLAVLAVLTVTVPATPLYFVVYVLPGFDHIIATRAIFIWTFCVAMLAGFGLDRLLATPSRRAVWIGIGCLAASLGIVVAAHAMAPDLLARHRVRLPDRELFLDDAAHLQAVGHNLAQMYDWSNPSMWTPLLWSAVAVLGLWLLSRGRSKAGAAVLLVGCALDLLVFAGRFNPVVPRASVYPATPPIAWMQAHAGLDRVMGVGTVKPRTLTPYHLLDLGGYDSFYPRVAAEYLSHLARLYWKRGCTGGFQAVQTGFTAGFLARWCRLESVYTNYNASIMVY